MTSHLSCARKQEANYPSLKEGAPVTVTATAPPGSACSTEPQLSYELRQGKQVFEHYCQTCHGKTGAGDGFNAFNITPRPRHLSDPVFLKAKSNSDLAAAINFGGAGIGLSPMMPPWGKTIGPDQVEQVVGYIRTLKGTDPAP